MHCHNPNHRFHLILFIIKRMGNVLIDFPLLDTPLLIQTVDITQITQLSQSQIKLYISLQNKLLLLFIHWLLVIFIFIFLPGLLQLFSALLAIVIIVLFNKFDIAISFRWSSYGFLDTCFGRCLKCLPCFIKIINYSVNTYYSNI